LACFDPDCLEAKFMGPETGDAVRLSDAQGGLDETMIAELETSCFLICLESRLAGER
jgi:hypothetical protein